MDEGLTRRLKWFLFFRLVIVIVSLGAILGMEGRLLSIPRHLPPYYTLSFAGLATIAYLLWARSGNGLRALSFTMVFVDVGLVVLLVYFTGFNRLFALLYFGVIIAASLLLGMRWGMATAFISTVLTIVVSVVFLAVYGGNAKDPHLPGVDPDIVGEDVTGFLIPYLVLFALSLHTVAFLAGKLSEEASRVRIMNDEILQTMEGGVLAVDRNGTLAFINRQAVDLLSLAAFDPVGRPYDDVLPDAMSELIRETFQRGERVQRQLANGSGTPLDVSISLLHEGEKGLRGLVAIVNDISVRRRLEEVQAQAERFKGLIEMSAAMAHEVRNPLASIRGAAQELAVDRPESEEDNKLLNIVMRESDRLDRIISDFLEYAGDKPMEMGMCDLTILLRDTAALVQARDDERASRIIPKIPGEMRVRGDDNRLKQVFLNLLLNAADACVERGKVSVTCEAKESDGGSNGFEVVIKDTGCGIPKEDQSRIFDPFFTTKPRGTGMGLAIASKIIQAHMGSLEIKSEQGLGTTCRVWLPAA